MDNSSFLFVRVPNNYRNFMFYKQRESSEKCYIYVLVFSFFSCRGFLGIALQTEIAVPTGFRCFKADAITVSSTEPWRHGWFECCSERHSVS